MENEEIKNNSDKRTLETLGNPLNKKINQFKNWIKKPYNLILIAILVFAIIIRLYYFFLTKNQPLWWDEAEYMLKAKNLAFGTPETGWAGYLRPIALPFFASIFFKLGFGEVGLRFLIVIFSILNIILIYLIATHLFNKKVGLISSFFYSVFYIDLFYSFRLLVDVPQVFFTLLGSLFFLKYFFEPERYKKYSYFVIPILFLGTLFRFTVGLFLIVLLIFLILTKGIKLLRMKEWYISGIAGGIVFLPYLIYSQINFGNPFQAFKWVLFGGKKAGNNGISFKVLLQYFNYLPNYSNIFFNIFILVGLTVIIFTFLISFDRLKKDKLTQKYLFLILWILVPFLFFGLFVNHFEDRYIFMIFPALFIAGGFGTILIYNIFKKYNKILVLVVLIFIIIYGAKLDLGRTNNLINSKLHSYEDFKLAGELIKENSLKKDIIFATGRPQLTYYSEREVYKFPENESTFLRLIKEKSPEYMVLSIYEKSPKWVYNFNKDYPNLTSVFKVYYINKNPSTIIYKFNK